MDGGATAHTDGFPLSTSLVLAKDSGRKYKTRQRAARRALVFVWLDIAQFVRDGMTALEQNSG